MRFALLVAVFATAPIWAAPIPDLFNTGSSAPGTQDPNWTVNGTSVFVTNTSGYPFPLWITDPVASWISPHPSYEGVSDARDTMFTFATTFTLPADFVTATIAMRVATDNGLVDVRLNGASLGLLTVMQTLPGNTTATAVIAEGTGFDAGLGEALAVDHTRGMKAGLNRLEFQVRNSRTNDANDGNPTGLNAVFSSDYTAGGADPVHTPEPSTIGLLGVGLTAFIAVATRRRTTG